MIKIKIYSGLTLSEDIVKKWLPQAQFSKPIKRDDIYNDIKTGVQVVGIIDGEFLQNLSVSPSEIRDALRCGLSVYGASSMGAIRAAELADFGMIGCGEIFEQIVSDPYFRDDKLGQIFFEDGLIESVPFVDFQFGALDLVRRKLVLADNAKKLIQIYLDLHFSQRNLNALTAIVRQRPGGNKLLVTLSTIKKRMAYQKKTDAISMLKCIAKNTNDQSKYLALLS